MAAVQHHGRGVLRGSLEALATHARDIQYGSGQTSSDWIEVLTDAKTSMDGKGRWIDNRMIARPWRSLKYECVYLHAFERGSEAKADIGWHTKMPNGHTQPMAS